MPTDFSFSLGNYLGGDSRTAQRIPDDFGPRQPMRGFEETYHNIIDYIVRITHRIWEECNVEYILDTYSDQSHVYDDYGLQLGNQKIVSDTHHTTGAFSNIELIADEVIWAGNDAIGFHTSHRTLIRGTNDGESNYGPATNRNIDILVIANCVALENKIFLEHVLYNTSSMLQQLGLDLNEVAQRLAVSPPSGWTRNAQTWERLRQATRPETPICISEPIDGFDVDHFIRKHFDEVWNRKNLEVLTASSTPDFQFQGPTNRAFSSVQPHQNFLQSIFIAFPDLDLQVDEVYWMGNELEGFLVSTRWSAIGTHQGGGLYGPPTARQVQLWGITQNQILDSRISSEWMLFNELDLMMQVQARR